MSRLQAAGSCLTAARGDEGSYQKVLQAMRYNIAFTSQTIFPCNCQPRCPHPTEEQMEALEGRLQLDVYGTQRGSDPKVVQSLRVALAVLFSPGRDCSSRRLTMLNLCLKLSH